MVVINACIIATKVDFGVSVNLFLELLLMLLVLVSHDVQNGISCDFDFVRWSLHFEFPSTPLQPHIYINPTHLNTPKEYQQLPLLRVGFKSIGMGALLFC